MRQPARGSPRWPRTEGCAAGEVGEEGGDAAGSGVTMVAGMFRGLSREDAARFAFLLATPVILAARCAQNPRPGRLARQRHPWPGPARQRAVGGWRVPVGAVPGPLLPDPHPHSVRHLLPHRWTGQHRLPRTDQVTGPGRPNVARVPPHMTHGPEGGLRPRNFGRRLPFNM